MWCITHRATQMSQLPSQSPNKKVKCRSTLKTISCGCYFLISLYFSTSVTHILKGRKHQRLMTSKYLVLSRQSFANLTPFKRTVLLGRCLFFIWWWLFRGNTQFAFRSDNSLPSNWCSQISQDINWILHILQPLWFSTEKC